MKIRQWLGYNEDASQYLLRPGELRILNNLQSRRPGMLISRRGLTKIYGKYDNEALYGLYRRATILGNPSDFLWFQKVLVERDLTAAQLLAQEYGFEYVWMVRRVEGNQSRIIDTLPISQISNMCVAEDRHGRMFLFYGHGTRPRIYRPGSLANVALPMGIDAPLMMPSVTPSGQGYFIEGVDVAFGGGSYYEPPTLTLTGGTPDRPAKLKAIVQTGNVIGVDIVDGGANYKTPPRIEASVDKVGTGFRARGNIVNSARAITGFDQTSVGAVTGTAPTNEQTYGATGGTANNSVLYLSRSAAVTERVITASGATITLPSVVGIQVGDTVTMYPNAAPFSSTAVTVTLVNTTTNVVTLSASGFTPAPGTIYEATFRRPAQVGQAAAEYDSARRRFTATIPLSSASTTGKGAHATLEFSPLPRGYGLNVAGTSTRAINRNWQTYRNGAGALVPFLYGEYWGGSDFDLRGSSENALYGGLQASRMSFVRGFSGSISGRRVDVYWPDYSKISVWFCTGTYTANQANWRRADVAVETEIDPITNLSAKVLRFRLKPTRKAKTVKALAGSSISTDDEQFDEFPDAVAPEVKLYLRECPDSWLVDRDFCLPKVRKEGQNDRLPWFSPNTLVPRPIVDITPEGAAVSADAVTITDPGSGWAKGTVFAFRIYQANSYAQSLDYNTAVVEDRRRVAHEALTNRYVEFVFNANTPDALAPHGPPHTLITPAQVSLPGDGYGTGSTGTITLYRRGLDSAISTAVPGQTITWTATTLDTLSATSAGYIGSITILNKGRNYFAPPTIEVRGGGNGYGLSVLPTVENGRIESVQIIDPGLSYSASPELFTTSRAAQLTAVMRPALRGKYRCAYRFADRSETVLGTVTANRTRESNTVLAVSGAIGFEIEPDMVLEAPELPRNCRVKSVNGNLVEVNQEVPGMAFSGPAIWSAVPLAATTQRSTNAASALSAATVGLRTLRSGETLSSPSLRCALTMQTDGNLVLYDNSTAPAAVLWNTATFVAGSTASLLAGGALVVQSPTGTTLWTSGTTAAAGSTLEVLDSGTVAIFPVTPSYTLTVRDLTKPIAYSDLSPIKDVDCGPNDERTHASKLEWSLTGVSPPDRADTVELWRTSADQSLVFYRVEAYGVPTSQGIEVVGDDTLTDEELFDPERPNYAAMPIVLPNGNVNAYRFGKPRDDMSVAVAFQDRLWMAVSTSGEDPNTLYYSEFDEFESFPDVNELPIQNNQRNTDTLTALVPFGSMLLAMQHTHTYAVAYNTDPAVDGTIQMMAHRGCLHQRAWDMHENVLYAADESGIYSMSRQGEVTDISLPIRDFFVSELLDYGKRDTFFLQADPRTHILRYFCTLKSNPTDTPAFALCFDIQAKTWWTESYPNSLTAACTGRPSDARVSTILLGGVDGNLYEIAGDSDHANDALTDTFVTEGGVGYREAPVITVPNVEGAIVQGVVSEGRLVDVIIQNAGWGASWGIGILAENGNPIAATDGRELKGVDYDAIQLDIGPPVPGGTQAVAYANFSVTPLVRRLCTVSQGQDYVRLKPRRLTAIEPELTANLISQAGLLLTAESGAELLIEAAAVEVGMEAIGPFIPLNSFVSRIDGPNVYLEHPDGTAVSMLFGDPRVYSPPTGQTWIDQIGDTTLTYTSTTSLRVNGTTITYIDGSPLNTTGLALIDLVPIAAERINGVNQMLFRVISTGGARVWGMTDSWEFLCVLATHAPGSAGFAAAEVAFRADVNGDGLVAGGPDWPDYGGTEMEVQFRKPVRTHIPFRMATGFMQLINEENAKGGDALIDRSVTLVYTPTPSDKEVEIIERFNGRDEMRANLMRRDRGGPGGFIHRQDSASTVLNTSREASHLGFATGVAKAKFASRVYTDMTGEDQHLQVELYGRPEQASPWERTNFWNPDPAIHSPYQFVLHSMAVNGVIEDAE